MVYPPSRDSRTVQWNNIALTKRMMVAKVVMMTMTMGSPQSGDSSAAHTESRAAIQVAPCSHVHPPWCLFYHHHEDGDDYLFHRHCCDILIVRTGSWDITTLQKAGLDEIFPRGCQSSHLLEVDPHQRLQSYKLLDMMVMTFLSGRLSLGGDVTSCTCTGCSIMILAKPVQMDCVHLAL